MVFRPHDSKFIKNMLFSKIILSNVEFLERTKVLSMIETSLLKENVRGAGGGRRVCKRKGESTNNDNWDDVGM